MWVYFLAAIMLANPLEYQVVKVDNGGTLSGRVYFEDDYPEDERKKVTRDNDVCGLRVTSEEFVVDSGSKGLANVVLIIENIHQGKAFPSSNAALDQIECRYSPHVMVVQRGEKLNITNQDPILHNIHAYLEDETLFNLAQPLQGQVTPKKMRKEGVVRIACDIHSWMNAYVLVLDSPYYAITDTEGKFEIAEIPPGDYRVQMWHEGLGKASKEVTVIPGEEVTLDFAIGQ